MSVMRFFRKYNKQLLAVFAVALMVAFLLPTALREMFRPKPMKREIGRAYGEKITLGDRRAISYQTDILNTLAGALSTRRGVQERFNWYAFVAFSEDPILDYLLLVREAKQMGLVVSPEQVDRTLTELKIPPELINRVVAASGISLKMFRRTVGNYLLVREAFAISAGSVLASEPQLRSLFVLLNEKIKIAAVELDASHLVKDIPEPTERELAAHFGKNQERFRFPDRIAVEYLEVDIDEVKKTIGEAKLKARARQYWREHKSEFTVTTTTAATSRASASASTQKTTTRPMTFEEASKQIIEKLKTKKAREKARPAIREARSRAKRHWAAAPLDKKTNLKRRPDKVADYQQLARELGERFKVQLHYYRTGLVSREEARELKGIGQAYFWQGRRAVPFDQYAFRVVPLVQPPRRSRGRDTDAFVLTQYEDSDVLDRGPRGDPQAYYLFRVIKVEPSRLPKSLNEVKDDVVRDWKLDQAYQQAQKSAEKLKESAEKTKLVDLVKSDDAELKKILGKFGIDEPAIETFPRRMFSPWIGELTGPRLTRITMKSDKFADKCFEKLWNQPTTQPDGRFTCEIIKDDENRKLYQVQLLEKLPALKKDYQQMMPWLARMVINTAQQKFYRMWFDPENIHRRTGFQRELPEGEG